MEHGPGPVRVKDFDILLSSTYCSMLMHFASTKSLEYLCLFFVYEQLNI